MSFGKDKPSTPVNTGTAIGAGGGNAYLGVGSSVVGRVVFSGPAILGGKIEGEVEAEGRLEIGETAELNAQVAGTEVIVRGNVHGDIIATRKLLILKPGRVYGNVSCGSLHIEDGAVFEGSCKMLREASTKSEDSNGQNKSGVAPDRKST
jgi:cytoskeletal protein CcmA (bactofilin family)